MWDAWGWKWQTEEAKLRVVTVEIGLSLVVLTALVVFWKLCCCPFRKTPPEEDDERWSAKGNYKKSVAFQPAAEYKVEPCELIAFFIHTTVAY